MTRAPLIHLTDGPVRVTTADKQPLRVAQDVARYAALDLELQVYEGTDTEVRLLTAMHAESENGWIEVDRFVPTSAQGAMKKTFFPLLRYARWEVLNVSGGTFLIHGLGRRRLGFVPTRIDGCTLWLRSDLSVTVSGGNVASWGDRSGSGHNATQSVEADKPEYLPTGGVNGFPGVSFDRANTEWMSIAGMAETSTDYTVMIVFDPVDTTGDQNLLSSFPGATQINWIHCSTGQVAFYDGTSSVGGAATTAQQFVTWSVDGGGDRVTYHRNGVLLDSGDPISGASVLSGTTMLGRYAVSDSQHFHGVLSEIVVYRRLLSTPELAQLHQYASARYGL